MCEIENDDTLGSYGKSHDIYVYREELGRVRMWERQKEESGAQGDKVCLFCSGGGV